eukprot:5137614-Pyramimonas_sp.AAC.1
MLLRTFVDDAAMRAEGAEKQVTETMVEVGGRICEQFRQAGLVICEKTAVLGSAARISDLVAEGFRRSGIP